jgi:hypothetical protein
LKSTEARFRFLPSLPSVDWFFLSFAAFLFFRLLMLRTSGTQGLSLFADDFFYYLKIAQNINAGLGSTFNGVVATNGYHPLWLVTMVLVVRLTGTLSATLFSVEVVLSLSALATAVIGQRTAALFTKNVTLSRILGLVVGILCLRLETDGMETVLLIPAAMLLLYLVMSSPPVWSPRRILLLSLLASIVVLCRLDSIIFVGLLGLALLAERPFRQSMGARPLVAAVLGSLPFLVYLCFNEIWFDRLLPVSGAAKQLRFSYGISWVAWRSVAEFFSERQRATAMATCVASLLWLPIWLRRAKRAHQTVALAVLLFPLIHLTVISEVSDWPLWPWYFYGTAVPLALALGILFDDVGGITAHRRLLQNLAAMLILIYCVRALSLSVGQLVRDRRTYPVVSRVLAAEFIANFAASHPGRYAMGDRSGVVGELLPDSIIQTEGLVMDSTFLGHIRRGDNLMDVLRAYHVRYYIVSLRPGTRTQPCVSVTEPAQGGPSTPHMRGTLCGQPIALHQEEDYTTLIYDLLNLR